MLAKLLIGSLFLKNTRTAVHRRNAQVVPTSGVVPTSFQPLFQPLSRSGNAEVPSVPTSVVFSKEAEGTPLPSTLLVFITSRWNRWNGWNNSIGNAADRVPTLFQPFQPPAAHTAVALAQFPTPARHAALQQPSTLADGLRVIPSAPEAPTRLPDAPCGREVGL